MPKVSIVMPLYNKSSFVHDAIKSILNQDYNDFELIIIDDKSTDNTMEIISKFNDARIIIHSNSRNMGQSDSLNNGIEKAVGEYITFAHGDDIWLADFVSTHVNLLDEHIEVSISHAFAHTINDNGCISYIKNNNKVLYEIFDHIDVIKKLVKGSYITTPTVMLRNRSLPFFNNRYVYSCDWDFWLRLAGEKNKFLRVNKPLIFYRYSSDNATSLAMRTGINIIDDYLVLTDFFRRYPSYCFFKGRAFRRMSMRTLRLSREIADKKTIFLYHKLAIVCSFVILINPVYYIYLLTGQIFGHKGMNILKKISKFFSSNLSFQWSLVSLGLNNVVRTYFICLNIWNRRL